MVSVNDPIMKIQMTRWTMALLAGALALGLGACTTTKTARTTGGGNTSFSFDPPVKQPRNPSNVSLKLSTVAQRLYVVEGDEVLLATPVSVGTAATPTPKGSFLVRNKVATRRRQSNPGAGYPMPYWIEFYNSAYGFHWGFVKPHPSTHGCVRMPLKSARKVFDLVRVGTPIHIAGSQPWDTTVGRSLPVLDDSALPDPPVSYMVSPKAMADIQRGTLWTF
jgi:hypothetical protein